MEVPTLRTFFNLAKCDENWELDSLLCEKLFKPIFESGVPEWIVLFPEVNIWTQEDSNLVKKQCQKYFLPNLENVLYPRFSGFYNVMSTFDTNPNKFTRLYDITISYTRKIEPFGEVELRDHLPIPITPPSLLEFFTTNSDSGRNLEVNIHVKSKLLSRIPTKRRKIEKWLEKSWMEKDRILALQKLGCVESPAIKNSTTPYIISIE